jgi:hypothetical protein
MDGYYITAKNPLAIAQKIRAEWRLVGKAPIMMVL